MLRGKGKKKYGGQNRFSERFKMIDFNWEKLSYQKNVVFLYNHLFSNNVKQINHKR